jgi:hypothetical protein
MGVGPEPEMKTVIVGSRTLEIEADVAFHVLRALESIPMGTILLRKPLRRPPRPFEGLVALLAQAMGFEVTWHAPAPGGRAMVFLRDVEMVTKSDQVIAFFSEKDVMSGGTGHVVEKALDQQRPVRAYAIMGDQLRLVGSEDATTEGQA